MKLVYCVGSPKCGTHALQRMVELFYMGARIPLSRHTTYNFKNPAETYVNIIRHPKNVLVSWNRMRDVPLIPLALKKNMYKTIKQQQNFLPWKNDPTVLTVKFEELYTEAVLLQLSEITELPPVDSHLKRAWGHTPTFTGKHSNWKEVWTEDVQDMWEKLNGPELEKVLGY